MILFHQRECFTNSDNEIIGGDFKHCPGKMLCDRIVHPFDGVINAGRWFEGSSSNVGTRPLRVCVPNVVVAMVQSRTQRALGK